MPHFCVRLPKSLLKLQCSRRQFTRRHFFEQHEEMYDVSSKNYRAVFGFQEKF
jgi:hypothetical protein